MSASPALRTRLWVALALVLTGAKLWLARGAGVYAIGSAADNDRLFVELAHHLVHGNWLGQYTELTLTKGPFYPLFIAAAFGLGVPLFLAQQVFYAAACAWFARALRPAIASAGARCAIYLLLLWNPMTFAAAAMGRVLRQHVYGPLLLMIFAGLVALYLRRDQPARRQAAWAVLLGLGAGGFYLTGDTVGWVVPAVLLLGAAGVYAARQVSRATLQRTAGLLGLAGVVAALPVLLVCGENYRNYGWFGTCEARSAEFNDAYAAMQRVRVGPEQHYVPVTREARDAMAKVSINLAKLQLHFTASPTGWAGSTEYLTRADVAPDQIGGGVMAGALRTAVARAGYDHDAGQARYFYKHLARELDQAIDAGHLPAGPRTEAWVGAAGANAITLADAVIGFSRFSARPPPSTGSPDELNLFRDVTGERLSPPAGELDVVGAAEYLQNVARVDRLQMIGKALRPLLLVLALLAHMLALARLVLVIRSRRWTFPLTLAAAVWSAVALRVLSLAVVETTAFPVLSVPALAPLYPLLLVFVVAVFWDAVAAWRTRSGGAPAPANSTGNGAGSVSV